MSYKVKIKINTDSDFVLKFEHPNTQYKYKSVGYKNGNGCFMDSCGHNCGCKGLKKFGEKIKQ